MGVVVPIDHVHYILGNDALTAMRKKSNALALQSEGCAGACSDHHVGNFAVRAMLSERDQVLRVLKVDVANNNSVGRHPNFRE